jgi:hypothetical protein
MRHAILVIAVTILVNAVNFKDDFPEHIRECVPLTQCKMPHGKEFIDFLFREVRAL